MKGAYVYISGPFSGPQKKRNIRKAIEAADKIFGEGHFPYCPHLLEYWNLQKNRDYDDWLELSLAWLNLCDVMIRLPGKSPGADIEEKEANMLGIPVFFKVEDFLAVAEDIKESEVLDGTSEGDTNKE